MLWATVDRHHGDQHMTSRSKRPQAASAAHACPDDKGESVVGIIDQIGSEAEGDGAEMMGMDAGSPTPGKATRQTPATRSTVFLKNQPFCRRSSV
jgi:hypothetical protein